MSKILLILQGIPGAGKSTWAKEFIKDKSEEWVIVNRDSIKEMLGNYWVPNREDLVANIENNSITGALSRGFNVIVDATNMRKSTITFFTQISLKHDAELLFKVFDIDLEAAIERDKNRERTVGEKVIKDFYNKYVKTKDK